MSKRRMSIVSMESYAESDSGSEIYQPATKSRKLQGDIENITPKYQNTTRKPTRLPKVHSRNAIMARQNRIRKKKYMEDLEKQVELLKSQVNVLKTVTSNQSRAIMNYRKEVKYLKSVLSNQSTICKLLQPIQESIQKGKVPVQKQSNDSVVNSDVFLNLGIENETKSVYPDWPSPNSIDEITVTDDFLQDTIPCGNISPSNIPDPADFDISDDNFPIFDESLVSSRKICDEHNYTSFDFNKADTTDDSEEDVGVCLHISKQRVSLEFCNLCNDKKKDSLSR